MGEKTELREVGYVMCFDSSDYTDSTLGKHFGYQKLVSKGRRMHHPFPSAYIFLSKTQGATMVRETSSTHYRFQPACKPIGMASVVSHVMTFIAWRVSGESEFPIYKFYIMVVVLCCT